jgi:hypothetical protein
MNWHVIGDLLVYMNFGKALQCYEQCGMLKTSEDDENDEMSKLDVPKSGKALDNISEVMNWMERQLTVTHIICICNTLRHQLFGQKKISGYNKVKTG